jgi:hypothetical protein
MTERVLDVNFAKTHCVNVVGKRKYPRKGSITRFLCHLIGFIETL